MLTIAEIGKFIDNDKSSEKKRRARKGVAYYDGRHDIKDYKMYYVDADGDLKEDKLRSNIKISHPFFTELVDQQVQYMLSGDEPFMRAEDERLQASVLGVNAFQKGNPESGGFACPCLRLSDDVLAF